MDIDKLCENTSVFRSQCELVYPFRNSLAIRNSFIKIIYPFRNSVVEVIYSFRNSFVRNSFVRYSFVRKSFVINSF